MSYLAPPPSRASDPETIEVGEVVRAVARGWRALLAGALVGVAAALAVLLLVRPRYGGEASVLVRNANDATGSLLSRFGIAGDLAGAPGGGLGAVLKSPLETELQLLASRDVLGQVIDSLGLQVRVLEPRGVPALRVVRPASIPGSFKKRQYTLEARDDGSYRVDGDAQAARPGAAVQLRGLGAVILAAGPVPARVRLEVEDREDAITRLSKRVDFDKKGGEVVGVSYAGPDSLTAAAVPNAIAAVYLERRRTTDRGLNQRRYEFLVDRADSVGVQLAAAEDALRAQQEATGVYDPEVAGRTGVDALGRLREELAPLQGERAALQRLVEQVAAGSLTPRQLTAFPSFLKSEAMNSVLTQITQLETERTKLLELRTERDPQVVALTQSIADLERQLLPLGRTYAGALDRQIGALEREQADIEGRLATLPGQAEGALRRQRDVKRLSQTLLALQAQLVDVRLAAVGEGGQVRQVDVARPPKRPDFPRPLPTTLVGLGLGLVGGVVAAVARGNASARVRTPDDAERAGGAPALAFRPGRPLLLGAGARQGTLAVVALTPDDLGAARVVAEQVAEQGRDRGRRVAVLDMARYPTGGAPAWRELEAAEREGDGSAVVVVAALDGPGATVLDAAHPVLLVARAAATRRTALTDALATLARIGAPCIGVVMTPAGSARRRAAGSADPAAERMAARGDSGPAPLVSGAAS